MPRISFVIAPRTTHPTYKFVLRSLVGFPTALLAFTLLVLILLIAPSPLRAQRGGFTFASASRAPVVHPVMRGGNTFGAGVLGGRPRAGNRARRTRHLYAGGYYPYDYPYGDSGDVIVESSPQVPQQIPPQIIVQTAAPVAPAPPPHTAEALVVELRGDHWVRLTAYGAAEIPSAAQNLPVAAAAAPGNRNTTAREAARRASSASSSQRRGTAASRNLSGAPSNDASPDAPISAANASVANQSPAPSSSANAAAFAAANRAQAPGETSPAAPLAVLVFRDGHQEEAARYTIIGSTIHIKTNFYTTGSWTRTVPISALDLPATQKANQARGSAFRLPTTSTEVIVQP